MLEQTADKVISFALIGVFVALGLLGIVLPVLPGILFLLIAVIIASRHVPALEHYLQQNRYTAKSLRLSHRFSSLDFWGKVQFCCWGILKITVDSVDWAVAVIGNLSRKLKRLNRGEL